MTDSDLAPVSVRGLSCGFGDRTVLRRLDLELPRDRTLCVLGPGGVGKSTLLRLLAGRVPAAEDFWREGTVTPLRVKSVGFLGQGLLDEAHSSLDILKLGRDEDHEAERLALEAWQHEPAAQHLLISVLDLPLRRLPTPLARFAAFTSMVAELPDLLLLDEPDAEMDDGQRSWLIEKLLRLRGRCSIVLTTHHLRLARQVSDECALLVEGKLLESGATEDLFCSPRNERTRRFLELGN